MPSGMGDNEYLRVFRDVIVPAAVEFGPDLVLVSAGFDAHVDDPLGGMNVTCEGFSAMAQELLEVAARTCGGKAVFVLEGGYDLVALEKSVVSVLEVMSGERRPSSTELGGVADDLVREVRETHGPYWSALKER